MKTKEIIKKRYKIEDPRERLERWRDLILIFTFIFTFIILMILIGSSLPKYEYRTQAISLNNSNFGEHIWVTDYLCDDGILVRNLPTIPFLHPEPYFYASAWIDADVHEGKCIIKIKEKIE